LRNLILACVGCTLLAASGVGAETYRILEGALTPADGGEAQAIAGAFEVSLSDWEHPDAEDRTSLLVDDFAFEIGDQIFTPSAPVEYQGLTPFLFLELADQIQLVGDDVDAVFLRAGGDVVAASGEEVTFRFLDFRAGGGRAIGRLGEGPFPRRLELRGTLFEVDQVFRIEDDCVTFPLPPIPPILLPPPDGGGVIVVGGANLAISYETFDVGPAEAVVFVPPDGGTAVLTRITSGAASRIDGELRSSGGVRLLAPAALEFASLSAESTPSLEALGITAPSGAVVTYEEDSGVLSVRSEGDIFIVGSEIDFPGLTHLVIETSGSITVTGSLVLPSDVFLTLDAGIAIVIDGEIETGPGGGIVVPPPDIVPLPFCDRLRAISPPERRELGSYSFVASAARQIEIDVRPRSSHNRVRPGFPQRIPVAILGAEDLDVRDVDDASLRLGQGGAEPAARRGRAIRRRDVNRDGHLDLRDLFDVREAEIAYGDEEVCLVAETRDGEILEGCDAIETLPASLGSGRAKPPVRPAP
jgi:filamentous hemagglutinin family protein